MLIANTPLDSYTIILPAAALAGERDVADLLSEVLAKATGVTLPWPPTIPPPPTMRS